MAKALAASQQVCNPCSYNIIRECLRGSVVNSNEPEIKCPFDNGDYVCGAVISEREVKAVSVYLNVRGTCAV